MIEPTIGRVLWYHESWAEPGTQPLAAIVTFVHDTRKVNLCAFAALGVPYGVQNVPLMQDGEIGLAGSPWCEWMPYQKGQAAKTERLEAGLAEARIAAGTVTGHTALRSPEPTVD